MKESQLLGGKTALIFGVANHRSIAWSIAQAFHKHGAIIGLSYGIPQLEKRVRPLAEQVGATFVEPCDVSSDAEIETVFGQAASALGKIDILVHSIAYAPREELTGPYLNTSREGFKMALDISAYSLVALTRAALPLMSSGSSVLTMTHYGSEKVFPNYNVMGVAKAALEASTRYLAADLGPQNIRVNAISAGPVKTLSAAGVAGFRKMLSYASERTPLRRNIKAEEVGNTALWLCSELGSGVTGETIYVDAGYHILGMAEPPENWE